ncbi:MAG TPA: hypothetical protein VGY54_04435 [Polyangiaceae bacterium]|jgi:hypothetical protein|nr:hypothetical protein [Polyangiaceae bacterium]
MIGRSVCPVVLSSWVAAGFATIAGVASADPPKQQCVDDNQAAQELRRGRRFAAASELLRRCAALPCPEIVRDDCARRLDDLERAQPSFVFEVRNASGDDVVDVRIRVDGAVLTDRLDGTPLKVDPGTHVFTFDIAGQPTVTRSLLAREGEASRHERVVVGDSGAPTSASSGSAPSPETPGAVAQSRGLSTQQWVGLSLAGAGAVGVVVGTVVGLMASSDWSDAKNICGGDPSRCVRPSEAEGHQSRARDEATLSTAAFIAGGALLVGGAVTYFTGSASRERPARGIAVAPVVEPQRMGIVLTGAF